MRIRQPILLVCLLFALMQKAEGQCSGFSFTADITNGCAPATIKFTQSGVPGGSEFSWNFGSGYTSYSVADSVKYNLFTSTGTYTIRMRIKIPGNPNPCTITKNSYITISSGSGINLYIDHHVICNLGDTVTFIDSTANVSSRDWIIEGVKYPNAAAQYKYVYTTAGAKVVSLKANTTSGCVASILKDSAVIVYQGIKVQKNQISNEKGCTPLSTTYNVLYSFPGQKLDTFHWSFPGGFPNKSTVANPSIIYKNPGKFSSFLYIQTEEGCNYKIQNDSAVEVFTKPSIMASIAVNHACNDDKLTFVVGNAKPDGGSYIWSFNPGFYAITDSGTDNQWIKAQFSKTGKFYPRIQYSVLNCILDTVLVNAPIQVYQTKPKMNLDREAFCVWPNDTVNFSIGGDVPDTPVVKTYKWTFYDRLGHVITTSSVDSVRQIYNDTGTYGVSLRVTTNVGCDGSDSNMKKLYIGPPIAKFSANPDKVCIFDSIVFNNITTPFTSNDHKPKFLWTFYDKDDTTVLKTDTARSPRMFYADSGIYKIQFIIYNDQGCADTLIDSAAAKVFKIKSSFVQDKSKTCATEPVKFDATTSPVLPKLEYYWKLIPQDPAVNKFFPGSGSTFLPSIAIPGKYDMIFISRTRNCADTVVVKDVLTVNGVVAQIQYTNPVTGCVPGAGKAKGVALKNYYEGFADSTIKWTWASKSSDMVVQSPSSDSTVLTFPNTGCDMTFLTYKAENSASCTYYDSVPVSYCLGNKAAFEISSVWPCIGDSITLTNTSLNAAHSKWVANPPNVTFLPSDTAESPYLVVTDTGDIKLKLYTFAASGCKDSVEKFLLPKRPEFDFFTNDTLGYCGPFSVELKIKDNLNALHFTWDFGDGSTPIATDSPTVSHLFDIMDGKSKFTISCLGLDRFNCKRTISKASMVKIIGPVPRFYMQNQVGCEPLNVIFLDSTEGASESYFFTDKGTIDTGYIRTPSLYPLKNSNDLFSTYKPFLICKDTTGCTKAFIPKDSIITFRQPYANFTVDDTTACAGQSLQFTDMSTYAVKWNWDFENDGFIDDTVPNPIHIYKTRGNYDPILIVYNQGGCPDTMRLPNRIRVRNSPVAGFYVNDSVFCFGQYINFHDTSSFDAGGHHYSWDFGDPSDVFDTSTQQHPTYRYKQPGAYDVTLYISDENGCYALVKKASALEVLDTVTPFPERLVRVSVQNDTELIVQWQRNPSSRFLSYTLFRENNGNPIQLFTSDNRDDTLFVLTSGIDVKAQYEDFYIVCEEVCNTLYTPFHRSIHLSADTAGLFTNVLQWNQYQGWDSVIAYRLYRTTNLANGYYVYQTLPQTDSIFVDYPLCDSVYYYYLEALSPDSNINSISNKASSHPKYFNPISPVYLHSVSVTPDEKIDVVWDTTGISRTSRFYHLYRQTENGNFISQGKTFGNRFQDEAVDVNSKIYTYKLTRTDHCFNISPESNVGRNILLKAVNVNDTSYLDWNSYMDWPSGIQSYRVELFDNNTRKYGIVGSTTMFDTNYIDGVVHNLFDSSFCYRIVATNNLPIPDISFSNTACVSLFAKLFIPNAFTPNHTGPVPNELYKPTISFVYNGIVTDKIRYEFVIYNRWGERVFQTNDLHEGWDGTFMGKTCPEDFYIYTIEAVSYKEHQDFNRRGIFFLMK